MPGQLNKNYCETLFAIHGFWFRIAGLNRQTDHYLIKVSLPTSVSLSLMYEIDYAILSSPVSVDNLPADIFLYVLLQFLAERKLKGSLKNIAKVKSRDDCVNAYLELCESKVGTLLELLLDFKI